MPHAARDVSCRRRSAARAAQAPAPAGAAPVAAGGAARAPAAPAAGAAPGQAGPGGPFWSAAPDVGPPAKLPPAGSGPVVYCIGACFPTQGGVSVIEPETYLYYIQPKPSRPSQDAWVPWNDETEKTVLDDFKRLWGTNFLDNLSIEVSDYVFPNGAIGKLVAYNMEERQRVKIVDYEGSQASSSRRRSTRS